MAGLGYDGSIRINTLINSDGFLKELKHMGDELAKQVKNSESVIEGLQKKREAVAETSLIKEGELDAEKAKLREMKESLEKYAAIQKKLSPILEESKSFQDRIAQEEKARTEELEKQRVLSKQIADAEHELQAMKSTGILDEDQIKSAERRIRSMQSSWEDARGNVVWYNAAIEFSEGKLAELDKAAQKISSGIPKTVSSDTQIKEQEQLVKQLTSDWNKTQSEVERYDEKIAQATQKLEQQRIESEGISQTFENRIQELQKVSKNAEVADQRVVDLSHKLAELQGRQKTLEAAGLGLGFKEYDETAARIAEITRELKEYQKTLGTPGKGGELNLQEISKSASEANNRLDELIETYNALREAESRAAPEARADIAAQAEAVHRQGEETARYLNELAENDILGKLSNGAEIAERRISDLSEALEELYKRRENADNSEAEQARLEKIIAANERLLESYQRNLEAAQNSTGMENLADSAEIANQRIVDLSRQLAELKARQKALNEAGRGLGYREYDENVKKISDITAELKKYQAALKEQGDPFGNMSASAAKLITALKKISPALSDGLERAFKDEKISRAFSSAAAATKKSMSGLTEKLSPELTAMGAKFGETFGKIGQSAAALAGRISIVVTAVQAVLKVIDMIGSVIGKRIQKVAGQVKNAVKAVQSIVKVISPVAKLIGNSLSKSFSSAVKGVQSFGKNLGTAAKGILSAARNMNVFSRMSNALEGVLKRLGNTIKSALVFSVIYKGLSMVRNEMASYLMVNQQFAAALAQIKGVLLTAFQPIYEVVVPALTTLLNILSHVIAAVSQFTATLFGTTAKKAQKNAEALYKQAHAMDAAGGAAKKAAKEAETAVAAFDEFNILSFPETDSGGGGGASGIEMPDFNYEYEDMPFDSWGEAFSAFLDKLLAGIPKLEEAFKNFADWLNDLAKKLYDMFKFPGVLDKVKKLGCDLAGAFNKLVNWIDWEMLGRALGAGLNLALNFLTSFLYAFDWMNLGRKLAEFVNGLVDEIDWYEFGRLLWAGFKIALETLAGFIVGLDMPLMARAFSDVILGFFDEMKNTIQRIPWYKIGEQLAAFLNNIKWYECLTSVIRALQAALRAMQQTIAGFVDTLKWGVIAEKIYTAINDSFGNLNWRHIGRTLGDAFVHVFDFVRELVSGIRWQEIGKNIADFILGFDFVSALSGLAQLIAAGINAAVRLVSGFLDSIEPEARHIAEGIANALREAIGAVDWRALGDTIGRGIKSALSFVSGLLDPALFYSIGKTIGNFLISLDWIGMIGGLTDVLARAINAAVAAVTGFLDSVQPNLKAIADGIANKINKFFEDVDWAELGKTISRGIQAALDFLLELIQKLDWDKIGQSIADLLINIDWDTLLETWGKVMGEALSAKMKLIDISGMLEIGKNLVKGLKMGWLEEWEYGGGLSGWLKRKCFDNFFAKIKEWCGIASPSKVMAEIGKYLVAGLVQGITEKWSGLVNSFKEKVDGMIKSIMGWLGIHSPSTVFANIGKNTVAGFLQGITEKWKGIVDFFDKKIAELKGKDWASIGKSMIDGIMKGLQGIFSKLSGWASSVWSSITGAFSSSKAKSSITSAAGGSGRSAATYSLASSTAEYETYKLPKLANGAVIPPNQQFAAILGDQRSGTNIEAPLAIIEKALQNVMDRSWTGGDIVINLTNEMDGQVLTRKVIRIANDITRASGKSAFLF